MRRNELKQLVDSTSDPSFAVDHEGTIAAWNSAAENLFGPSEPEALGRRCGDILLGARHREGRGPENQEPHDKVHDSRHRLSP